MHALKCAKSRGDEGAVVVLVTVLVAAGLVFTLLALVVDLGSTFEERRETQNAADAAAVALAERCAFNDPACATNAEAQAIADAGSSDLAMRLLEVCGAASSPWTIAQRLSACSSTSASPSLNDCRPITTGQYPNFIRVRTATRTRAGQDTYPSTFGSVASGTPQALASGACAQVAWGAPRSARIALPFLVPICPGNIAEGPFQLLDFFANTPTQNCGTYVGVTRGWAPGALYGGGTTCDTGVTVSVGQVVPISPSTTQLCGDPNVVSDLTTVLTAHLNTKSLVPVVGPVTCLELDKNGQPKKNCGQGSYAFTVVGFKDFTLLGFNLHNGPPTGATPSGGWDPRCDLSRDCLLGSVSTGIAIGTIDPSNSGLDFGVRVISPLP